MAAGPAPELRPLMDERTFLDYFNNRLWQHKTYLCYEVKCLEGDLLIPLEERKGWLCNQDCHAETIFQEWMASWILNQERHYTVTCFISWSPCVACAYKLAAFLRENSHVHLRIFAARIYERSLGYEAGLRELKAAGAEVAMMTVTEFKQCWDSFVNHQDRPFQPWDDLDVHSNRLAQRLGNILQYQEG